MPRAHVPALRAAALFTVLVSPFPAIAQPDLLAKHTVSLPTGITMAYVEAGNPEGEPVLFFHGFTDTSRSFLPTIDRLVARAPGLRVFAVDQRGHGASSMPPAEECRPKPEACFQVADLAADALAFMDVMGIERAHLVGHSLGSLVVQEIALTNPERVGRIVLIATAATTKENPTVREFLLASLIEGPWKAAAEAQGMAWPDAVYAVAPSAIDSSAAAWLAANWVVEPLADPAYLADIQPETERIQLGTWLGVAQALTTFDNTARLKDDLAVPALVLWGTHDTVFTESDQTILRDALVGCNVIHVWKRYGREPLPESGIPGNEIGHNLQWAAPDAVAADIVSFMRIGRPTPDLHYGDPNGARRILTAAGEAELIELPGLVCTGR